MSFDSFQLDPVLLQGVRDLGFEQPTDIQQDAIPWALEGRDLLACAMTGSGKTAAFGLPILQRLVHLDRGKTRALILSPTRELALQTEQHLRELGKHTDVSLASIFGGVGYEPQERAFRQGYDILVATPGRLLDLLGRPWADLDDVEFLVLDEADRMLDMGFIPDVRRILKHVPRERQTMLFSATLAKPIVKLAGDMLNDPVTINLERRSAPAEGVRQAVYPVRHELKPALLLHLLQRDNVDSALVFTRTKERADLVGEYLRSAGIEVAVIHGDRTQKHRTRVMKGFKEGRHKVMVATDVAARGIDVEDLSHVINLDVPNQPDDYIHRVGRTARAGATGDAITFVAARELADLHLIEKAIGQKLERIRLEDFDYSRSAATEVARSAPKSVEEVEPTEVESDEMAPEEVRRELGAAKEEPAPRGGRAAQRSGRRRAAEAAEEPAPEPRAAERETADEEGQESGPPERSAGGRGRGRKSAKRDVEKEDEVTDQRREPAREPAGTRDEERGTASRGRGGEDRAPRGGGPQPQLGGALQRFAEIRARRTGRELPEEEPRRPSAAKGAGRREEGGAGSEDRRPEPAAGGRPDRSGRGRDESGRDRGGRDQGGRDRGGRGQQEGRDRGGRDQGGRWQGGRDRGGRDEPARPEPSPRQADREAADRRGSGRPEPSRSEPARPEPARPEPARQPAGRRPAAKPVRRTMDPEVLERYAEAREYRREHGR